MGVKLSLGYITKNYRFLCVVNESNQRENCSPIEYKINSRWDNFWRLRRVKDFLDRNTGQFVDLEASILARNIDPKLDQVKRLVDYHNRTVDSYRDFE
ncbi:MAG: hypothetical protein Q7S74_02080 [Nanoarchaeota archaeon]|nr:hypothetical protein [Nanoarchaeota archaeon]